jgi:hypothetical protein
MLKKIRKELCQVNKRWMKLDKPFYLPEEIIDIIARYVDFLSITSEQTPEAIKNRAEFNEAAEMVELSASASPGESPNEDGSIITTTSVDDLNRKFNSYKEGYKKNDEVRTYIFDSIFTLEEKSRMNVACNTRTIDGDKVEYQTVFDEKQHARYLNVCASKLNEYVFPFDISQNLLKLVIYKEVSPIIPEDDESKDVDWNKFIKNHGQIFAWEKYKTIQLSSFTPGKKFTREYLHWFLSTNLFTRWESSAKYFQISMIEYDYDYKDSCYVVIVKMFIL